MSVLQVPGPYEDTTCQMVAAYGRPDHEHLEVMRAFRDTILLRTRAGKRVVDAYYAATPYVARLVQRSRAVQLAVRFGIGTPFYRFSRAVLGLRKD